MCKQSEKKQTKKNPENTHQVLESFIELLVVRTNSSIPWWS